MYSQAILLSALAAFAEARFAQEQVPIPAISALSAFGSSGQAATLAGGSIQFLLAAANPCGKLTQADNIVSTLGTDPQVIAAARGLVAAEQNFNPFVVSVPSICDDPTLPTTQELRGVVPLVDPAVGGSDTENANQATSLTTPFDATGLSVAQVMAAQGFSNFTTKAADGTVGTAPAAGSAASADAAPFANSTDSSGSSASNDSVPSVTSSVALPAATSACGFITVTVASSSVASATPTPAAAAASGSSDTGSAASSNATTASSISGLDFGSCVPTMKFEAGLNGRADTEFTFQAIDPLVNKGQQEALNPNIITNRICDQLTNVCNANEAAKTACAAAKAQIAAIALADAKVVGTADTWNTVLGFAGANTNPDNAPQAGLVGHD